MKQKRLIFDTLLRIGMILLGSAVLAFGLYHVHSISRITEGGILGLTLLLQYWFHISPSFSSLVMNLLSYAFAFHVLGRGFLRDSLTASISFAIFYAIFESFDPLWPNIAFHPLSASITGAIFVGIGVGFCVRAGAATGGDDAIAMAVSAKTGLDIQWVYLLTDLIVLLLSLSYIPWGKIVYSLITVILSGQIIGLMVRFPSPYRNRHDGRE